MMLFFGGMVVVNRNPVASALSLVVSFLALAALYVSLDAYFIGVIQILVYAGAVMVLFLFIIMLLDLKAEIRRRVNLPALCGGFVVIILFVLTFALGTIIYPTYRLNVRTVLQEYRLFKPEGSFELKEHFMAISLALLPAYWYFWRKASESNRVTRAVLTSIIAFSVWWGFITGHVINNIRGFGS